MSDYLMRAKNTALVTMVYWESSGQPDFTGTSSPYLPGDLEDAIVVRVTDTGGVPGTAWTQYPFDPNPIEALVFVDNGAMAPDFFVEAYGQESVVALVFSAGPELGVDTSPNSFGQIPAEPLVPAIVSSDEPVTTNVNLGDGLVVYP